MYKIVVNIYYYVYKYLYRIKNYKIEQEQSIFLLWTLATGAC